jgi:hypothetical protein
LASTRRQCSASAALSPASQAPQREEAAQLSKRKRITGKQVETIFELLEQARAAGEWRVAHGRYDEAFCRVTGTHRMLSSADEDLIDQTMANTGDSRDEVIRQLWAFGGL